MEDRTADTLLKRNVDIGSAVMSAPHALHVPMLRPMIPNIGAELEDLLEASKRATLT